MKSSVQFGYFLFSKPQGYNVALKDMLQFMRTESPRKNYQFAHVECESSLLPHLSLWENIHMVTGGSNWTDLISNSSATWKPILSLIKNPNRLSRDSEAWEKMVTALLKADLMNAQHIIIEIDENVLSPFNLVSIKKIIADLSQQKQIYISTQNTSLWLDFAHSLVSRNGYEFVIQELNQNLNQYQKTA